MNFISAFPKRFSLVFQLIILVSVFLICSCKKEDKTDPTPALVLPGHYDTTAFSTNTFREKAILAQFKTLVDSIKKGRSLGQVVSRTGLNLLFEQGNPSLFSLNTAEMRESLSGDAGWFARVASASGNSYTPGTPTGTGGVFGGYLFDQNGLEPEQLIEKGQFGSVLFHQACLLMESQKTPATADQVLAIMGSNPTFPNTTTVSKTARPDAWFATYLARRDKNDGQGFYDQMKRHLIRYQAACKAGEAYAADRNAASSDIRMTWEKANGATIINYCHSVISTMSKTSTTDFDKAGALHALGECIGFSTGFLAVPSRFRIITDSQLLQILDLLRAPKGQTPTCYLFVTRPVDELGRLSQVISLLKSTYGFTDTQIEDFRKNWIQEQGR